MVSEETKDTFGLGMLLALDQKGQKKKKEKEKKERGCFVAASIVLVDLHSKKFKSLNVFVLCSAQKQKII